MSSLIPVSKKIILEKRFIPFNIINRRQIINCPIIPAIRYVKDREIATPHELDNHYMDIQTESAQDILSTRNVETASSDNRNKTQLLILFMIILRAISNSSRREAASLYSSSNSTFNEINNFLSIDQEQVLSIGYGETIQIPNQLELSGTLNIKGTLTIYRE